MDMNRKNKFGLKNKKIQMAASFMKTFVLVLSACFMMAATAHAGAFLTGNGNPSSFTNFDLLDENDSVIDTVELVDRTDTSGINETWNGSNGGWDDISGDPNFTGYYLGTFKGNDQVNEIDDNILLKLIHHFLEDDNISFLGYAKHDLDDNPEFENKDLAYDLKVTSGNGTSGTWSVVNTSDNNADTTINFYSVKGAKEFALYYVEPEQSNGNWTTAHLLTNNDGNIPAISHFSVVKTFDSPPTNTDPVPEPATMLLFGFSLMGLAGLARRRNSKF